jgi:serine/threonine-protein kinase
MGIDGRVGRILGGKWRVETVLGRGGTSTVYAATHVEDKTRAALKVMHTELTQKPAQLKMLLAEARLVAAIEHPGTVKVLDEGVSDDGCSFLVFELLVGQTLEELRQARGGRVPIDEVMRIGDAVMDALAAVHEAGVVHRDLKPANIFVLDGGGVKLLDFGFAKLRGYTADAAQDLFGTPSFMPPEQAMGLSKKVDAQSDVWSLGATLFTVLSGESVHIAKHMNAMLLASQSVRPRSLADAAPELPRKIATVVDKALEYRKAERWPDIRSMREAWKDAHPHWLPPLPPPSFAADPSFLDASALVAADSIESQPGALFDPRDLLNDSTQQKEPPKEPPKRLKHPGALPNAAKKRRRLTRVAIAVAAVLLVVAVVIASALTLRRRSARVSESPRPAGAVHTSTA